MTSERISEGAQQRCPVAGAGRAPGDLWEKRVHRLFERHAAGSPDAPAVACGAEVTSYAELNRRANRLARHLQAAGVGPDVLVAVFLERSPELVVALLAVLKAGGVWLPLDPDYPPKRLALLWEDADPPVLLTRSSLLDRLPRREAVVLALDSDAEAIERKSDKDLLSEPRPENLAYLIYTSGSMGRPKGVMITHGNVSAYVRAISSVLGIDCRARWLHTASVSFSSSMRQFLVPLSQGAAVVIATREQIRDPLALFTEIRRQRVTVIDLVPSYWQGALRVLVGLDAASRAKLLRNELELVLSASEPLPAELPRQWALEHPARVVNMFGQTETTGIVLMHCVSPLEPRDSLIVPIGKPLPHSRAFILDEELTPVPAGAPGELYIGGEGVGRGYWKQPGLTSQRFRNDPFAVESAARLYRTGDIARQTADGTIEFLGRLDDQVKIRGFRIEPDEVAHALAQHPAVRECAVVGREGTQGTKQLVAYVVLNPGLEAEAPELRAWVASKLPDPMVPAVFVRLESLPRTPSGKLDRFALPPPEPVRSRQDEAALAPPRTETERLLAEIWAGLLGIERVGIDEDFFELGGDSIASFQMIAAANRSGIYVTSGQVIAHPTVAGLARVAVPAARIDAEQGPVEGPLASTPIARWFWEHRSAAPNHYNQAVLLETRPGVDPARLRRVFETLLVHHDALRLRCVATEEGFNEFLLPPGEEPAFSHFDFSAVPDDARSARDAGGLLQCLDQSPAEEDSVEAVAARLQASLDLSRGPIARAAFFDFGELPGRLLLCAHHLAVDGVSWRILLEDLYTGYEQLGRGEKINLPPKTTSFRRWSEMIAAHADSPEIRQHASFWLRLAEGSVAPLPRDGPAPNHNTVASTRTVSVSLSDEETRMLLKESAKAYRADVNELLLTALVRAFEPWTRRSSLLVELEGQGREEIGMDVDLSRTVGWFTILFPVVLDVSGGRTEEAVRRVKEQYRETRGRQMSYGLLRYLGDAEIRKAFARTPRPEVRLNYLGQFDRVLPESSFFQLTRESPGPACGPEGIRPYVLDLFGSVLGGKLRFDWAYSENLHRRATAEALAERFAGELRGLTERSQWEEGGAATASDFPLARLDQAKLDQLMERVRTGKGPIR